MILITGATGFLGAHTACTYLEKGHNVKLMRRSNSSLDEFEQILAFRLGENKRQVIDQIEWVEADVLDTESLEQALQGINTVIHCAATVSFSRSGREAMKQANIEGTANLVNCSLHTGVSRFVHVSSTSALSRSTKKKLIDETCDYINGEKNSGYGLSKFGAEMEVWRGVEEGLNAVIINPSVILGFGDWNKGSCKLFMQYANKFPFYSTGGNSFVGVEDVAECVYLLHHSDLQNERYLCLSENLPFKDLFFAISEGFGRPKPWIKINKIRSEIAWRLFSIYNILASKPLITKESARASVATHAYDNSKIKEALGFEFEPIKNVVARSCEAYSKVYP